MSRHRHAHREPAALPMPSRESAVVAAATRVVVVLAVLLRYEALLLPSRFVARTRVPPRPRMLVPVLGPLAAHVAGIRLRAGGARLPPMQRPRREDNAPGRDDGAADRADPTADDRSGG